MFSEFAFSYRKATHLLKIFKVNMALVNGNVKTIFGLFLIKKKLATAFFASLTAFLCFN